MCGIKWFCAVLALALVNHDAVWADNPPQSEREKLESLERSRRDNCKEWLRLAKKSPQFHDPSEYLNILKANEAMLEAELATCQNPKQRLAAYELALKEAQAMEKSASDQVKAGFWRPHDHPMYKDAALQIEIAMLRERVAAETSPADADAKKIELLLKVRRKSVRDAIEMLENAKKVQGRPTPEEKLPWHDKLLAVELELTNVPQQRLAVYAEVLKMAQDVEASISDWVKAGLAEPISLNRVKDATLRIEIAMLKEKMALKGK